MLRRVIPSLLLTTTIATAAEPVLGLSDAVADGLLANCGACKVDLDSGWDLGHLGLPAGVALRPWAFSLRHDRFDQDRLNHGARQVALPPGARGLQHRITTLDGDYRIDGRCSVGISIPWVVRHLDETEVDEADPDTLIATRGRISGLGDVQVVGQCLADVAPGQRLGVIVGFKLPTGSTATTSTETTTTAGVVVDQAEVPTTWTVHPGNGATELILGALWRCDLLDHDLVLFLRPQAQIALVHQREFRPGNRSTLNAGMRYQLHPRFDVSLQATGVVLRRDGGGRAEPAESGGEFLTISPGIAWYPTSDWQLFANGLWQPWSRVNGEQYVATRGFSLGTAVRF